jgi:hypothetical protein
MLIFASGKQIAEALFVDEETIRKHVRIFMRIPACGKKLAFEPISGWNDVTYPVVLRPE